MSGCLTIAMASAWVPPGDQLRQTWPHLGRQIWSVRARQEVFTLPICTQHLRPRPPHPHHGLTYFYWWFLCLEVLVGEVAVQPSTILAGHTIKSAGDRLTNRSCRGHQRHSTHRDTHFKQVNTGYMDTNMMLKNKGTCHIKWQKENSSRHTLCAQPKVNVCPNIWMLYPVPEKASL